MMHFKKLFTEAGLRHLAEMARAPHCLIGFDYDGTLAPMHKNPDRAKMRKTTEKLLVELCKKFDCALVTGRGLKDIKQHTQGVPFKYRVGNHGIETETGMSKHTSLVAKVARWKEKLGPLAAEIPGVFIEDKKYSLSVHYQFAAHPASAYRQIMEASSRLPGVASVPGKNVVNVVARTAPNKGTAFAKLLKKKRYQSAIFIGDDITDENVFRMKHVGRKPILSLRIGELKGSKADYVFNAQSEIDRLLRILIKL